MCLMQPSWTWDYKQCLLDFRNAMKRLALAEVHSQQRCHFARDGRSARTGHQGTALGFIFSSTW